MSELAKQKECKAPLLVSDMHISRLMVNDQYVEEEKRDREEFQIRGPTQQVISLLSNGLEIETKICFIRGYLD